MKKVYILHEQNEKRWSIIKVFDDISKAEKEKNCLSNECPEFYYEVREYDVE